MVKRKIRILFSPTLTITILFILPILPGFHLFTVIYEPCRRGALMHIPLLVIWSIIAWGFPIAMIATGARRCLCIITIDETGISRSVLGKFCKLHIPWDDMAEVYYFISVIEFLMFSKSKKVSQMTYWKATFVKDAIQISLSKRRYAVIKQYLQQPIVGMPEKVKMQLEKSKHHSTTNNDT